MVCLTVDKSRIKCNKTEKYVSGAQNVYQVSARFSSDWDGLRKTITFTNGEIARSDFLPESGEYNIPWEVLEKPGLVLSVGFIGDKDGNVVLPTVWFPLGKICQGAEEGDPGRDPSPSKYDALEQITQGVGNYGEIRRVEDYLYEAYYNEIDYRTAYATMAKHGDFYPSGCSGVRKGRYFGGNLDWIYDDTVEFVVHTPRIFGRYASVSMCGGISALNKEFVASGEYSPDYRIIPFRAYDGVNECGVSAKMNVVPLDKGENFVQPTEDVRVQMSAVMMVRYIIDHFATAFDAVDFITKHAQIYFPESLHGMGYELHFMVADPASTYLLEFENNRTIVVDMTEGSNSRLAGKPYMTNFYLYDMIPNANGSVYTPAISDDQHNPILTNGITENGSGLERYNIIASMYGNAESKEDMRAILNALRYTKAYATAPDAAAPAWYTEFVGIEGLTVVSPVSEFTPVYNAAGEEYLRRTRDGSTPITWQTVHSSLYDLENKTLSVVAQESGVEHTFSIF